MHLLKWKWNEEKIKETWMLMMALWWTVNQRAIASTPTHDQYGMPYILSRYLITWGQPVLYFYRISTLMSIILNLKFEIKYRRNRRISNNLYLTLRLTDCWLLVMIGGGACSIATEFEINKNYKILWLPRINTTTTTTTTTVVTIKCWKYLVIKWFSCNSI